jgi:hypothetical protein
MQAAEIKLTGQVGGYEKVTKVTWKFATSAYIAQQTERERERERECVCVCVCGAFPD